MTVQHEPHTLFEQEVETVRHYRLFLDDLIQEGAAIHGMLNTFINAGESDTLEMRINSGGGFIRYGQQFTNIMAAKFSNRFITVLDSEASSMAAVLFRAGDKRIIHANSVLMVHDMSIYTEGKSNEAKRQMDVYIPAFKQYFTEIFKDSMTKKEIKKLFKGKDYWFNAVTMCERNIATDVIVANQMYSAEEFLEMQDEVPEIVELEETETLEDLEAELAALETRITNKLNIN